MASLIEGWQSLAFWTALYATAGGLASLAVFFCLLLTGRISMKRMRKFRWWM
ncbi:MAG: hypothetical protein LCH38_12095 [Proteobacteria bacterium]|nr:hypothetical protein [Pseudomonadota bacterium]